MGAMRQKIGRRERMRVRKNERKKERKPWGKNMNKRVRECEVQKRERVR